MSDSLTTNERAKLRELLAALREEFRSAVERARLLHSHPYAPGYVAADAVLREAGLES